MSDVSAPASLSEFVQRESIRLVRVGGTDIDGIWRGKNVAAGALGGKALGMCDIAFGMDCRDLIYEPNAKFTGWSTGWPDFQMIPDIGSARAVPWSPGVGSVVCDWAGWDDELVAIAPRTLLRRIVERAEGLGYEPKTAMEWEFTLLRETAESLRTGGFQAPKPLQPGNFTGHPWLHGDLLVRWVELLQAYGLPVEGTFNEWGAGQFEINLKYAGALTSADDAMLLKSAIKELARKEDLTAVFMARIGALDTGASGHLHLSLWQDGANVFAPDAGGELPEVLRFAVGGLVACLPELAAFFLPLINSYRRIEYHLSSPTKATWGIENRTCSTRVVSHGASSTRIENRVPGADVNPYLANAVTIAACLHGIEHRIEPPAAITGDGYDADGVALPRTLDEAVDLMDRGALARSLLGEEFVEHFLATRRVEIEQFRATVTDWERERYLETV